MGSVSRDQFIAGSTTDFLRSPVLENLKLEDPTLSGNNSVSESSENEEEHKQQRNNENKNKASKKKTEHEESRHEPPDQETQEKLLKQLEYYFSDENLTKDQFLLKHVRQSKSGYVSLKLLATFKRVQKLSKDWRDLRYTLTRQVENLDKNDADPISDDRNDKSSPSLELNNNGTKVRRVKPWPDLYDAIHDRTIVVFNYQTILKTGASPTESITDYFSGTKQNSSHEGANGVVLVRLTTPDSKLPDDLKPFQKFRQEISRKPCALIEFKTVELAQRALLKFDGQNDWRGLQVLPLKLPEKKQPHAAEDHFKNQPKKFPKDKQPNPASPFSTKSELSSMAIVDVQNCSGSPKPTRSRTQHQGPASPHTQHSMHRAAHHWESGRNQADRSPCASVPACHLIDHSPLSCSPSSLGNCSGSPWLRKKMQLGSSNDLAAGQREANRITAVRQPRGPDGSKGFCKSIN